MGNGGGGYGPGLTEHLPFFEERQTIATETLFDLLAPRVRSGDIHTIVDLGCGSGEILVGLAELFRTDRRGGGEAIRLIGIDNDETSIVDARRRLNSTEPLPDGVSCTFELCATNQNCLDVFRRVFSESKYSGRRAEAATTNTTWPEAAKETAVFCLGHTIFHLPYLPDLLRRMVEHREQRPRLWVMDVYHSWDLVLTSLSKGVGRVDEPRHYGDGGKVLYVLSTKWSDDATDKVERELISRRLDQADAPQKPEVSTQQFAWPTGKLIDEFAKAGYFVARDVPAVSGYGEMVRFVLEPTERTFELPALFLDGKAVPNFPHQQTKEGAEAGADAAGVRDKSHGKAALSEPMRVIAQWIRDSGFIGAREGRGFDFVMVETAPWFFDPGGRAQLRHELLICAKEGVLNMDQQRGALTAYEAVLTQFLADGESLFFHPDFVGRCVDEHWAPVHFSLESQGSEPGERPVEGASEIKPLGGTPDEIMLDWPGEIDGLLLYRAQADFTGSEANHHVERHWPAQADRERCLREGLDALHQKLHQRTRIAFGEAATARKTVLLAIPLRARLDPAGEHKGIPDWFRGGVWIFAGASGQYEGGEHALLGDLARLTMFLQISAIEAKAIQALTQYISDAERRLEDYFGTGITAWKRAVKRANDELFKEGLLHNEAGWGLQNNCEAVAEDKKKVGIEIARMLWSSATGAEGVLSDGSAILLEETIVPAVVSLFAAAKYQAVSVYTVARTLAKLGKLTDEMSPDSERIEPKDLRYLMSREHPNRGGRVHPEALLIALGELLISGNHHKNKLVKSLNFGTDAQGKPIWSIAITFKYESDYEGRANDKARRAKEALEKQPWIRAAEPGRNGRPGQATRARWALGYLSRDAAGHDEDYNPPLEWEDETETSFKLVFRFDGGELPDE